jgi:hypothetical protein
MSKRTLNAGLLNTAGLCANEHSDIGQSTVVATSLRPFKLYEAVIAPAARLGFFSKNMYFFLDN